MTASYFDGENEFKEAYQRDGLRQVMRSVHRELEDIQSLMFTVSASLEGKEPNEHTVSSLAGDMTSRLQYKLDILEEYLTESGKSVVMQAANPRHQKATNNGGDV